MSSRESIDNCAAAGPVPAAALPYTQVEGGEVVAVEDPQPGFAEGGLGDEAPLRERSQLPREDVAEAAVENSAPRRERAPHPDPSTFAPAVPVAPLPEAADLTTHDVSPTDPRAEDGAIACWEVRGCAGIWGPTGDYMERDCPHNLQERYSPCPQSCAYTRCQRPWHREATRLEDLLDPNVDRMGAIKEQCRHCLHFIAHGPRAHRAAASS